MNKKSIVSLVLAVCIGSMFCSSCGKINSDNGENVKNNAIKGVVNIDMSYKETEYDFLSGVSCDAGNVTVESDVVFGKSGTYTLLYKAAGYEKKSTVRIFGEPVYTANDVSMSYSDAVAGSLRGIKAYDSFGESITTEMVGIDGNPDYLKFGSVYKVNYTASDKVGNKIDFFRKIKVKDQMLDKYEPLTVDLADNSTTYNLNGKLLAIVDSSENVYKDVLDKDGDLIGLNRVCARLGTGEHEVMLVTTNGYGKLQLTVKDDTPERKYRFNYGHEFEGINNYIYAQGEKVIFPEIVTTDIAVPISDVEYALFDENGDELDINVFSSENTGKYTYTANISAEGTTIVKKNTFYVMTEKEKDKFLFSVNSNQFLLNYQPHYEKNAEFDYVGGITDARGVTYNAVRFKNYIEGGGADQTLRFDISLIEKLMNDGYFTVSMKIMFTENFVAQAGRSNIIFIFGLSSTGYTVSKESVFSINSKVWTTLTFDLRNCWNYPWAGNPYTVDENGKVTLLYNTIGLWPAYFYPSEPIYIADVVFS